MPRAAGRVKPALQLRVILRYHKSKDPAMLGGLTVLRNDGSSEHQALRMGPGFIAHEFAHYAAETQLHLHDSFLGLLSRGRRLGQMAQTAENWGDLPVEALQTEFLAAQFQSEFVADYTPLAEGSFNEQLGMSCERTGLPRPRAFTAEELDRVRTLMRRLLDRWSEVRPGEAMDLHFPASPAIA